MKDENTAVGVEDVTRRLATFTESFALRAAPAKVIENAKIAILDCLGVSILATTQEIGAALMSYAEENGAPGICTVWGTSRTTSDRDAAFMNGTLAHGLDFDDRNHSSTYSLATSFAVAERHDLPGWKVLEAFIVGREIRNCLDALFSDRGSGVGPGAKGWHSNGILGPMAAACAAAKVLDLSAEQILAAIGLAAGSSGALTRDGGTMAKPFRTGHAGATGLTCALLAKHGFSSDDAVLEGRYGLLEALGPIPETVLASLAADLGRRYNLEAPIRGKRYASCSASHTGLDAMLRLRRRHAFTPEQVASIECDLKPYPLVRQIPKRGIEGRFSMPFCLAVGLIHDDLPSDGFTDRNIADPSVRRLMECTHHTPGQDMLVVTLSDGSKFEEPLRKPIDFTTWDEIAVKFRENAQLILGMSQCDAVIAGVQCLEHGGSARALAAALKAQEREQVA
jgi:2-methylcitrate dehydratase PrpD